MVSVDEASSIVFSNLLGCSKESVRFSDAVNRVLAERITADRDFPPFHRVSMDGIAILFDEWKAGRREFNIEDVQAAGVGQKALGNPQNCLEVMTGAILPAGADTVVRYEDIEVKDGSAFVQVDSLRAGQNIHKKGQDAKAATVLLEPGMMLSAAEVALLASVGKSNVQVYCFPTTAIVATGDELVDVQSTPLLHQIRRSNTYAIQAAMKGMGWEACTFHLADKKDDMVASLKQIVGDHEVVVLSGGVSKGKFDFVPEVLEEIGVRKRFYKVNQKPGKPFWFGTSDSGKVIFALPGNPVSTFMCFFRYVKPWALKCLGIVEPTQSAILAEDFSYEGSTTYFLQVAVKIEDGVAIAYPRAGGGSGDFANLKDVNGFLELPSGPDKFQAGQKYACFQFRHY
jgi:molybdopterin molybdotransferase